MLYSLSKAVKFLRCRCEARSEELGAATKVPSPSGRGLGRGQESGEESMYNIIGSGRIIDFSEENATCRVRLLDSDGLPTGKVYAEVKMMR